jgi:hypothetical protein
MVLACGWKKALRLFIMASASMMILLQFEFVWRENEQPFQVVERKEIIPDVESTKSHKCKSMRGEAGKWVQDWEYAERANYPVHGSYNDWYVHAQKFRPTLETPFRWATTWRWEDEECPVHEISLDAFCRVSWQLNLTRYLFMGDSLTIQFLLSMLSLLGLSPKKEANPFQKLQKPILVPCSFPDHQSNHTTVKFNITLWAFRRKQLKQWAVLKQQVATNTTGSDQYHQFVQTNPNRTAVVANAGAWMNSTDEYVDAFDSLLAWLDSLSKGKVMAFFRATLPGHVACKPLGEARDRESYDWTDPHELHESPYQNYSEYSMAEAIQNKPFNWRLVESFNEYAHNLLTQRQPDQLNVQWLNVFPSTILRRLVLVIVCTTPYRAQPICGCICSFLC